MHASGMMHMPDDPWVTSSQPYQWAPSSSLLWHGSMQGSTWLHCGCCPALPSTAQTVLLLGASVPFQLTYMSAYPCATYEYKDLQSSIQDPSSAVVWPKLQIHDSCLLRCPVCSDPSTRVATWRSFERSFGRSGPSGYAGWTIRYASRAIL